MYKVGTRRLAVIYILLYVTILSPYIATPSQGDVSEATQLAVAMQWFVPSLSLILLTPTFGPMLAPLLKVRFWTNVGLLGVLACTLAELMKIPGLSWSWSTIGLVIVVWIWVANEVQAKTGDTDAVLAGWAVVLLGIASFEIVYQTGLLLYHSFFGATWINYCVVLTENLMWITPALIIVLVLQQRYALFSLNSYTLICFALLALLTTIWFAEGMHIPLYWDGNVGPFYSPADPVMIAVSRGSQGFFCYTIATLALNPQPRRAVA